MAVVISNNMVANGLPSTKPLTHARIGYQRITGTLTASSAADGYPASAANNQLTYTFWQPESLPATWEIDAGQSETVNYFGIAAHEIGSKGCEVFAEYHDGATWVSLGSVLPADNSPIMFIFNSVVASRFRVRIIGPEAPRTGVIYIGEALEMYRPIYGGHAPITMSNKTVIRPTISDSGQWLGRSVIRKGSTASYSWDHNPAAWVRQHWKPFIDSSVTNPFFIAWRPETFPNEIGFCWTTADVTPPSNLGTRDLMSISLDVLGYGNG